MNKKYPYVPGENRNDFQWSCRAFDYGILPAI